MGNTLKDHLLPSDELVDLTEDVEKSLDELFNILNIKHGIVERMAYNATKEKMIDLATNFKEASQRLL